MSRVEKARIADVPQIHQIINTFAAKGIMLPRPLSELYENIRDYFVVRVGDEVLGCASLHVSWEDTAEVRSVVVVNEGQHKGVGSSLVNACLDEAKALGIATVFCLTYQPEFFERFAFLRVDKMELPRKVWSECYHCPKFPNCDEVAMVCRLGKEG